MRSIAAASTSNPKCGTTRRHTASGSSAWSMHRRPAGPRSRLQHRAEHAGRELGTRHGRDRQRIKTEMPRGMVWRRLKAKPARRRGKQRRHCACRVALNPDPWRFGKSERQDRPAADVQLVHLSTNRRSLPCRQRPSARTTRRTSCTSVASSIRSGSRPSSALSGAGSVTTTIPGSVPRSRDTRVEPHRER